MSSRVCSSRGHLSGHGPLSFWPGRSDRISGLQSPAAIARLAAPPPARLAPSAGASAVLLVSDGLAADLNSLVQAALVPTSRLGASADPIGAITAMLQRRRQLGQPVRELHLLAHGEGGRLRLGGEWIDQHTILGQLSRLAAWRLQRLALWSCGLGGNGELLNLLAASTGAEVFSSPGLLGRGQWWIHSAAGAALHAETILTGESLQSWASTLAPEPPQVSVSAITNGNEATGSPAIFRFSRTGSTADPLAVSYRLLGTAQAGSDYSGASTGTISFAAGSSTAELSLPALADSVVDPGETIIAQIVPDPAATASYSITPGQQTAIATITAERMVVTATGASRQGGWSKGEVRNSGAFAALKSDGTVVTWGASWSGGDSSAVASQLGSGVSQIFSAGGAFAALKADGSVVTWGSWAGGDSNAVASQLSSGVSQIFSTSGAFAALKADGSVVSWGYSDHAGDSSAVASQLSSGVSQIFSTVRAFAALKADGSVVTWGESWCGGDSSAVASQLSSGVSQVFAIVSAFAALKADGSVVTWGVQQYGGYSGAVASQLSSGVSQIFATSQAFAALKADGSVVTWGESWNGGDSSAVASQLSSGVIQIFSTDYAFAALKADGSVVTWGRSSDGGDSSAVASQLSSGVSQIFSTYNAFAALKADGSVVTWCHDSFGGDSSAVASQLSSGVSQIFSTGYAFAALKADGSVVTWGSSEHGGDSSAVASQLSSGVSQIFSTDNAFAALKADGSVVTWGHSWFGGDSSAVASQLSSGVVGFSNPFTNDRLLQAGTLSLANYTDSGSGNSDFISTGNSFDLSLSGQDYGSSVVYQISTDGGSNWSTTSTAQSNLADGAYQFRAVVTDAAGNTATTKTLARTVAPQVAVSAIANGNEASGNPAIFRFSRTGSTTAPLAVSYRLLGTAQAGRDYSGATTGTISFAAGSATAELWLPALADSVVDPGETIIAQIEPSPAATASYWITPGQQTAIATITAEGMVVAVTGPSRPLRSKGEVSEGFAFAALKADGSVVSWGHGSFGGNSSAVASQLSSGVSQIFSTGYAFAALKADGSVVTWGWHQYGGDSRAVASQLGSGISQIFANYSAFAALKTDGSVVTWGGSGSNSSAVASQLSSGVNQIFSTGYAFAALKANGSVVSWGDSPSGGDSSAVASQLSSGVHQIFATDTAFAALKADGSVVTWGESSFGGNSSAAASQLSAGVSQVFSNSVAFAALKANGSVVTWGGYSGYGGAVASQLSSGVSQIFATSEAFAALKGDGSVVTWGNTSAGGDSSAVASQLSSGVSQIFATKHAFAALKADGSVVTWGLQQFGADSSAVAGQLNSGVSQIFATEAAFAALKADGSVVSWGDSSLGGDSGAAASQLSSGVSQIFSAARAFAALKDDGSVVAWGDPSFGGDSSAVASQLSSGVVGFANPFSDDRLLQAGTLCLANFTDSGNSNSNSIFISTDNSLDLSLSGQEDGASVVYQLSTDGGSNWSATATAQSNLADGAYQFRAVVSDAAGTTAITNTLILTVDTAIPSAGTLSLANYTDSGSNSDFISNDNSFDLSLSGQEDGTTVVYQASTDGGSNWSAIAMDQNNISDGTYQFRALVIDAAGNSATTNTLSLTVDATVPNAPAFSLASDSGASNSDGVTNVGTVTVSDVEENATWDYSTDSGSNWTSGTGSSFDLAAGSYAIGAIRVRQSDLAGNTTVTPSQNEAAIIVDLTPPTTTATVTTITDNVGIVQGTVSSGASTDDASLLISGTISAALADGETVRLYDGNTELGDATISGTSWSYADSRALINNQIVIYTARVTNLSGNQSAAGNPYTAMVDTRAPDTRAVVTAINDDAGLVQGTLVSGGSTDDTSLSISGTLTATLADGESIRIYDGSSLLGAATVSGNSWSFSDSRILNNGQELLYRVGITDAAGNINLTSNSYILSKTGSWGQAQAEAVGMGGNLVTINDAAENQFLVDIFGGSEGLWIGLTDEATEGTFSWASGEAVTYTEWAPNEPSGGNQDYGWINYTAPGKWDDHGSSALYRGIIELSGYSLTIDTSSPSAPSIISVSDDFAPNIGNVASGDSTNDTNLTVQVLIGATNAIAGDSIQLYDSSIALGSAYTLTSTDITNGYADVPTGSLSNGTTYTINAKVIDVAGNSSSASDNFITTIDTTPPAPPTITSVDDDVDPMQGNIASGSSTNDTTLMLTGTAEANSTVTVYNGANNLGTASNNGSGAWTFNTATLDNGSQYSFTTTATDATGNVSGASAAFVINVDTTITSGSLGLANYTDSGTSSSDFISNDNSFDLSLGGQESGATVGYEVSTNGGSDWTSTTTAQGDLSDGSYQFRASVADAAGNTAKSNTMSLRVDAAAPNTPLITSISDDTVPITGSIANGGSTNDTVLLIAGTADANSNITIYNGNASLGTATIDSSGAWTFTTATLSNGSTYLFNATATDAAGNVSAASDNYTVTVDTSVPNAPSISAASDDVAPITGTLSPGDSSNDTNLTVRVSITGTDADEGDKVQLYDSSITLGSAYTLTSTDISNGYADVATGTLTNGTSYTINAKIIDIAGNASTASNYFITTTVDTQLPTAPAITLGTGVAEGATAEKATAASGVVKVTAETGSLVVVSFSNGSNTVNKVLTGDDSTVVPVQLTAAELAALGDGTITVVAIATDAAGNDSPTGTASFILDTTPPAAPTIALGTGVANGATASEATASNGVVTVTAETNASVVVTFTNGSNTVTKIITGNGSTPVPALLNAADLTTLGDGLITVSAIATDTAGNISPTESTSFSLDTIPPAPPVLALGTGVANGATTSEATAITGVVTVTAEVGAAVEVIFTNGTNRVRKTVTGNGSSAIPVRLNVADLFVLGNGAVSVNAIATDSAGNPSTAGSTSFTLDTNAPAAPALVLGIGVANGANSSEATAATGVVTLIAEAGSAIVVSFANGNNTVSKTVTGNGNTSVPVVLTTADLITLGDGTIATSAVATDAAGNTSPAGTTSFRLDTSVPLVPILALGTGVGNGATTSEATAITGIITVAAEFGSSIVVTFSNGSNAISKIVTGNGSVPVPVLLNFDNLVALGDGTIAVSAVATDASGNTSPTANISFSLDTSPPLAPTLELGIGIADDATAAEATAATGAVTVIAEAGTDVIVTFTNDANTVIKLVTGNGNTAVPVLLSASDLETLDNGTITVSGVATDAAGNISLTGTTSFRLDTLVPDAILLGLGADIANGATAAEAMADTGVVTFTAETGVSVVVTFSNGSNVVTKSLTGNGSTDVPVVLTSDDLATLGDGTITVNAIATDSAGNISPTEGISFTLDTIPPARPGLELGTDIANGATADEAIATTGVITISAEFGSTVDVIFSNGSNTITKTITGDGSIPVPVLLNTDDLAVLGDGTIGVSAIATDAAGNASSVGTTFVTLDTSLQAAPVLVLGTGVANGATASEATAATGVITVAAEENSSVVVTFSNGGNTVTKTLTGNGSTPVPVQLNATDLAALGDGTISVDAVATDAAGNASPAGTVSFSLDTNPPAAPALALGNEVANGATASEATASTGVVTLTAEANSSVIVTFSNGGNTVAKTIAGNGSTPVPVQLNSTDLAVLGDGTITVAAVATDAAGNASLAGTVSFRLDTNPPAAPALALGTGVANGATASEATTTTGVVTLTAEANSSVVVTFSNGGNTVTKTVTGNGSTPVPVLLSADNLATLGDGTITVDAVATDAAGNASPAGTVSFSLDTNPPAAPVLALGTEVANGATSLEATATTGAVTIIAERNSSVVIAFSNSSNTLTKTVTGNSTTPVPVQLNATDLAVLGDGTITVTAVATDVAGNASPAGSITFTLDTNPPAAPALALGNEVANGATASEATASTGVVTLTAEANSSVIVTFSNGGNTVTKTVAGNGSTPVPVQLNSTDLAVLGDGTITVAAVATDAAGNASLAGTVSFRLDTNPPAAPALTLGNGVVNGATASEATTTTGVVMLTAEAKSSVIVTFSNGGNTVTKTVTGNGSTPVPVLLTADNLATLGDGTITVDAVATDAAGNASPAGTVSFSLDTNPPAAPVLALGTGVANGATASEATATTGVVRVTAESGSDIAVTFSNGGNTVSRTVTGTGSTPVPVQLNASDLAELGDGTITVDAVATDAAGNISPSGTISFTLDTISPAAPVLALGTGVANGATASEATAITGVVTLTAEVNSSVVVTLSNGSNTVTKTITGNGSIPVPVLLTTDNLASLGDGTIGVSAIATDAAGNTSSAGTTSFRLDTIPAAAPVLALGTGVANGATVAEATASTGVVAVTAETSSSVVAIFTNDSKIVTKSVTGTGSTPVPIRLNASDLAALGDGTITVVAVTTDTAGNASSASTSSFTLDTNPPAVPALALGTGIANGATASEATATTGVVTVKAEFGSSIVVAFSNNGKSVSKIVTGNGSNAVPVQLNASDLAALRDGTIVLTAVATDAAGNISSAGTTSFTLDTIPPAAPAISLGTGVADGATADEATAGTGVVSVTAESKSLVVVTFSNAGSTVTKIVTGNGSLSVPVQLTADNIVALGDGIIEVSAVATDTAGNLSSAGTTSFTLDTIPPPAPVLALGIGISDGATAREATTTTGVVTVSAETGAVVVVTFSNGSNTVTKTITGNGSTPVAVLLTADNLTTLGDGTIGVAAYAADNTGNNSSADIIFFSLDTIVPSNTAAVTAIIDNVGITQGIVAPGGSTDDTSLAISGTLSAALASGESVHIYDGTEFLGTASVSGNASNWSFADPRTLINNQAVSYTARVADIAGNQSAAGTAYTATVRLSAIPTTAAVSAVSDDVGIFQGTVAPGGSTDDTSLAISGTLSAALATDGSESVRVYDGAEFLGIASVFSTSWSYADTRILRNNQTVSYTARVADTAGNQSAAGLSYSVTADTAAPNTGTLSLVDFTDSGPSSSDRISNDRDFTLSLKGQEAGSSVIYQRSTDGGSTWADTIASQSTLADTSYQFRARVSDAAGNTSSSKVQSVVVSGTDDRSKRTTPQTILGSPYADILIGGSSTDTIVADNSADTLSGGLGADTQSGGLGADSFVYRAFAESSLTNLDRISDLTISSSNPSSSDRITLNALPSALWSTGVITPAIPTLESAVAKAFADKNVNLAGSQALSANEAVLFGFESTPGNASSRQWYIAVNDNTSSYSTRSDLLINVTGITGSFSTGSLTANLIFSTI